MGNLLNVDWAQVLMPQTPLLEIFVRGSLVYLVLFTLLRGVLKRVAGTVGIADLLMIVLIADAAQNAMANDYKSITDGLLLVGTIVGWNYTLDWLGYRFPRLQQFLYPPALTLVKNGRLLHENMRRELITTDELMSQIRQQGVESLERIKVARMEGDGRISVVTYDEQQSKPPERNIG